MFTKLFSLVCFISLLTLTSVTFGIQLGDFENDMDGWSIIEPNAVTSFSTIGATLNQNSLRIETTSDGNQDVLVLDLIAMGLVEEFRDNLKISADVTRLTSEWTDQGGSWCDFYFVVRAAGEDDEGNEWDFEDELEESGVWLPDYGDDPMHFTYDYSLVHDDIMYDYLDFFEYFEIVIRTNHGGYDPGGVYYLDNVQIFGAGAAYHPTPPDGERELPVDTTLRWTSGLNAETHDIYFGASLEDVTNASRTDPLGVLREQDSNLTTYDPGELITGTSYFWRIDAVNGPDIYKGEVWSFTTVYPGTGVVLGDWEDSLDGWVLYPGSDAILSYSTTGATLNEKSLRMEVPSSYWVIRLNLNPGQLESLKANDLLAIDVTWLASEWEAHSWSQVHKVAINSSETGWSEMDYPDSDTINPDDPGSWPSPEFPDIDSRTLIWDYTGIDVASIAEGAWTQINISQNHDPEAGSGIYYFDNARLINVRRASDPKPAYQETDVRIEPTLSWTPGRYSVTHNVYISSVIEEISDVNIANLADYPNVIFGTVDAPGFQPGRLEFNTPYYWRVDEVNEAHPDQLWKGDIWNFTTGNYIVVDDFEAYNDLNVDQEGSKRIYLTWTDGYENPSVNGSTIGYPDPYFPDGEHFVEIDIVHGGGQSGPLLYDNSTASYSEVTVNTNDLTVGSDWTRGDVQTLNLWFFGDPNNDATEQLYVKLNNIKILYDGDIANLAEPKWTQWSIDLSAVGINLANVSQFGIGLERISTSRGKGMLFIDDIRLYRQE
jgi:hypothetical protein